MTFLLKVPVKTASKEVRSLLRKFPVKENIPVNEGGNLGNETKNRKNVFEKMTPLPPPLKSVHFILFYTFNVIANRRLEGNL